MLTCPILIVDDDPSIRENLAVILEQRGHKVETAANGLEALEKLDEIDRPCLVILDLVMPVMDGRQFRAELSRRPDLADLPVVIVSGVANVQKEKGRLDAVAHIAKPISLPKLYSVIDRHCHAASA